MPGTDGVFFFPNVPDTFTGFDLLKTTTWAFFFFFLIQCHLFTITDPDLPCFSNELPRTGPIGMCENRHDHHIYLLGINGFQSWMKEVESEKKKIWVKCRHQRCKLFHTRRSGITSVPEAHS